MNYISTVLNKLKRDGIWLTTLAILKYFSRPLSCKRILAYKRMLQRETLQERFSEIYEKNFWSSDESASGPGSDIEYTEHLRNWLVKAIPRYQIEKIVDTPINFLL